MKDSGFNQKYATIQFTAAQIDAGASTGVVSLKQRLKRPRFSMQYPAIRPI